MTDTPAPSVPTSPPAGPAVSPEIDALIEAFGYAKYRHGMESVRESYRPVWTDKDTIAAKAESDAARAALREAYRTREAEVARLTKERNEEVLVSSRRLEYIVRLEAESCRLQQEALTPGELFHIHEVMLNESCGCATCRLIRAKLARISAHKEKEWARSSDISGKEKE